MNIQCKRVYDPAEDSDGYRVLVDRLWPRGIKKADLVLNEWVKALAPRQSCAKLFTQKRSIFSILLSSTARNLSRRRRKASGWRRLPASRH